METLLLLPAHGARLTDDRFRGLGGMAGLLLNERLGEPLDEEHDGVVADDHGGGVLVAEVGVNPSVVKPTAFSSAGTTSVGDESYGGPLS